MEHSPAARGESWLFHMVLEAMVLGEVHLALDSRMTSSEYWRLPWGSLFPGSCALDFALLAYLTTETHTYRTT